MDVSVGLIQAPSVLDRVAAIVINGVRSEASRRAYSHAVVDFVSWHAAEARSGLNKAVVQEYRAELEKRGISPAHIYNLRKSRTYRERRVRYEKTRAAQTAIGERRPPKPDGRPGYIRVDTVHQGDLEGSKGVYHVNAVDEVTQWQVAGATAHISEAWLLPVLEGMLEQFPFQIRGFHSDNGSEFINHPVAKLLNKLLAEQTKSRPRRSNDNGLVEAKNGAVIRKHMGYGHIASAHAEAINTFYSEEFNPYLNFHRPCGHAEIVTDAKGKKKRVYGWYATPWEALRRLPGLAACLRPELTLDQLEAQARSCSDVEAARRMQESKRKLFATFVQKRTA